MQRNALSFLSLHAYLQKLKMFIIPIHTIPVRNRIATLWITQLITSINVRWQQLQSSMKFVRELNKKKIFQVSSKLPCIVDVGPYYFLQVHCSMICISYTTFMWLFLLINKHKCFRKWFLSRKNYRPMAHCYLILQLNLATISKCYTTYLRPNPQCFAYVSITQRLFSIKTLSHVKNSLAISFHKLHLGSRYNVLWLVFFSVTNTFQLSTKQCNVRIWQVYVTVFFSHWNLHSCLLSQVGDSCFTICTLSTNFHLSMLPNAFTMLIYNMS